MTLRHSFRQDGKRVLGNFVDVLTDGGQLRLNALELIKKCLAVEVFLDKSELFLIELGLEWSASGNHDHLIRLLGRIYEQPVGKIDSHIAHADHRNPLAGGEVLRGKRW